MVCPPLDEDEEDYSDSDFMMPKFQGQPSDAVDVFCGPNIGLVWPWKSRTVTEALEVHGHRLRGQYSPLDYKQLQEDLDNSPQIQQALAVQQALLEVRTEAQGMGWWPPVPVTAAHLCPKPLICL